MMKISINIKTNYVVIAGIALAAWFLGGYFSWQGMTWYDTLALPAITPEKWVIRTAWRIIFPLTTFAAIFVWNTFERNAQFWAIISLFIANLFLNVFWSHLFFVHHAIGAAFLDVLFLEATICALIYLINKKSTLTALLLLPYCGWVGFAIILNFLIWQMN